MTVPVTTPPLPHRTAQPSRLPRWARIIIGLVAIVAACVLILRPFTSVSVMLLALGIALLIGAAAELTTWFGATQGERWWHLGFAVALAVLGASVLFFPALGVRWLVIALGAGLLLFGLVDLLAAVLHRERRVEHALGGAANLIFGLLALVWVDVTVVVAGALFGIWLLGFGARVLLWALRSTTGAARPPSQRREWPQIVVSALTLAVALLLAVVGGRLFGTPSPDAFYAAPAEVPGEPGQLIRAEAFTRGVPKGSTAWRMLYTTTREDGVPAIASGLVVVPDGIDAPPVIAWAHGTTGAAVGCAPTLQADPLKINSTPVPTEALAQGWAIVATDYVGLGADAPHPYMVGEPAARSVLDALRAATQLDETNLGRDVVVWGHSQGGGAALWTGGVAAEYAPEIAIAGVAAGAPAADLPALVTQLADGMSGTVVGPLVLAGFTAAYPDVKLRDYVVPEATLLVQETIARCWTDPSMIVSIVEAGLIHSTIWSTDPNSGPLGARLTENVPHTHIAAPLLIGQGLADQLILPEAQQKYVDGLCQAGQALDYRTFPGLGHMQVVQKGSPFVDEIIAWTEDRFAGKAATSTCG